MWRGWGGDDKELRRGVLGRNKNLDNVSKWKEIKVKGGRVTALQWNGEGLFGAIPAEIGALSALNILDFRDNKGLSGELPPELSNLTSLTALYLNGCSFTGAVPSSLAKVTNLDTLSLYENNFSSDVPFSLIFHDKERAQAYLTFTNRSNIIHLLNFGIKITAKRQDKTTITVSISRFFSFLANNNDIYEHIMSFLDPCHCCAKDWNNLMKCWKAMGGDEDELRQGYDVSKWKEVTVGGGRVTKLIWHGKGLSGTIPTEIRALSSLTTLVLSKNSTLGGELPPELGNLTSLSTLYLLQCSFSGLVPSSLANLTNLHSIDLHENNFTTVVPNYPFVKDREEVQQFLLTLK